MSSTLIISLVAICFSALTVGTTALSLWFNSKKFSTEARKDYVEELERRLDRVKVDIAQLRKQLDACEETCRRLELRNLELMTRLVKTQEELEKVKSA